MWDVFGVDIPTAIAATVALVVWLVSTRRKQRYAERKEAFEIHEALTTREVLDAMAAVKDSEGNRNYLVGLHRRTSARYQQFSDVWPLPDELDALVSDRLDAIHYLVPKETGKSQRAFTKKQGQKQKQDHGKNPEVQAQINQLAGELERYPKLITSVKRSRESAGQSMLLMLVNGTTIYLAGHRSGLIPSGFEHKRGGCQLNSVDTKRPLAEVHQGSMKVLATEVVAVLRKHSGTTCSCGEVFP